jgi:hypothetical protein
MTVEQNRKLFSAIQKKLGAVGNYSVEGWFVNVTPSGSVVRLNCKTSFAVGEEQETFVWRVNGRDTRLVGYKITSLALISD